MQSWRESWRGTKACDLFKRSIDAKLHGDFRVITKTLVRYGVNAIALAALALAAVFELVG